MKVTLVTSGFPAASEMAARQAAELARGARARGAEVDVITPGRLRERLRRAAVTSDLVDVHTPHPPLAFLVAAAGFPHTVLTPCAPIERFTRWPHARITRNALLRADRVVCTSDADRRALCRAFAGTEARCVVIPPGIDEDAIGAARVYATSSVTILTIGKLRRPKPWVRVLAAMAIVEPPLQLVVAGDGPARRLLESYAADLRVQHRVRFLGAVSERERHRWLRTARVVVSLSEAGDAGFDLAEGLAAGASVVASDIALHREIIARAGGSAVLVAPGCSPLDVADAIMTAAVPHGATTAVPALAPAPAARDSWNQTLDATWALYEELVLGAPLAPPVVALDGPPQLRSARVRERLGRARV